MKTNSLIFFIILVFFINCSGRDFGNDFVLRLKDKKLISFNEMIEEVINADIIVVGENHDVKEHHDFQLKVIREIYDREKNIAIGMEMFKADSQAKLNEWVDGKLSLREFQKIYYDNWKIGWPFYADILIFAKDKRIPIIGLNVPPEITRKVAKKGFASLTTEELKKLPEGVICDISEAYMEFVKRAYNFHGTGRDFVFFCEAQMLWDRAMAINTINYMKKHNVKKVILITGKGHAWKHAIPEQIKKLSNYKVSVILPNLEDSEQPIISLEDADFFF